MPIALNSLRLGRIAIWSALVLAHLGLGAWASLAGGDKIAAIVAGSIYLPLWPFDQLGVPVFHRIGWFFPPPTVWGWLVVITVWASSYWYLATFAVWLFARRR